MTKHPYIAFIFARGGSKGVKDKNIRPLAGKPLIAHSIATALSSPYIESVIVSTESEKIAELARLHGAEVLQRPKELAEDATPELLAWRHAIQMNRARLQASATFISLPATSPLRATEDIDKAIDKYEEGRCDILFGICQGHRNPYLNMVRINDDNLLEIAISGSNAVRRQDVPDVYDVTTCVYVANIDYVQSCNSLMEGKVGYIEIPVERAIDIDTEFDLYLADLMLTQPFRN